MELADLKLAIIVQARMGSTRLPGKVMLPLNGSPVLEHVLERCAKIAGREKVICAGVDGPDEAPIKSLCEKLGIRFFAGDEKDVLSRYYYAAKEVEAEWVMRITSDCPLIDPLVCRGLIREVVRNNVDFGVTADWPHGLDCEFFTMALLEESYNAASLPEHYEHVTLWAKNSKAYTFFDFKPEDGLSYHDDNRWVVDYPEDYIFLREVFSCLDLSPLHFPSWVEIYSFISAHAYYREINKHCIALWRDATQSVIEKASTKIQ